MPFPGGGSDIGANVAYKTGVETGGRRGRQPAGRKPQFDAAPRPPVRGWRCATGSESHEVTALAAQKHGLQAPRRRIRGPQIWHFVPAENEDGAVGLWPQLQKELNSSDQRMGGRSGSGLGGRITENRCRDCSSAQGLWQLQVDDGYWSAFTASLIFYHRGLWCVGTLREEEIACWTRISATP